MFMFLKVLHPQIREKLVFLEPDPPSLNRLIFSTIIVENLIKKNALTEHYYTGKNEDAMDVDVMKITKLNKRKRYGQKFSNYLEESNDHFEERRKGLCFLCKQPVHLKFNCSNKIKPKKVLAITKEKDEFKKKKVYEVLVPDVSEYDNYEFYISTNDTPEFQDKQLIQEYKNKIIKKHKSKKSRKNSSREENQPELFRHKYNPFVIEIPSERKS